MIRALRNLTARCEHCGHRFRRRRDPRHSFGNADGRVYHGPCIAYVQWRRKAEERLRVVGLVCDLAGITGRDVTVVVELRAGDDADRRIHDSNEVWRVFYDLEQVAL